MKINLPDTPYWNEFRAAYAQPASGALRWVAPVLPQREAYYRLCHPGQEFDGYSRLVAMVFTWSSSDIQIDRTWYGRGWWGNYIGMFLDLYRHEIGGEESILHAPVKGDFVLGNDRGPEQYRAAFEGIIGEQLGFSVSLSFRETQETVTVLSGRWRARNSDGTEIVDGKIPRHIDIFGPDLGDPVIHEDRGSVGRFARALGDWIDQPVLIEGPPLDEELSWRTHHIRQGTRERASLCRDPELVLRNIQQQSGLVASRAERKVRRLFIERTR